MPGPYGGRDLACPAHTAGGTWHARPLRCEAELERKR
jgi:hypothetical protein